MKQDELPFRKHGFRENQAIQSVQVGHVLFPILKRRNLAVMQLLTYELPFGCRKIYQ